MKFSLIHTDRDGIEFTKYALLIDNSIFHKWLDNSGVTNNSEETGKITWLEIFSILRWVEENWLEIKHPFYEGENITITQ